MVSINEDSTADSARRIQGLNPALSLDPADSNSWIRHRGQHALCSELDLLPYGYGPVRAGTPGPAWVETESINFRVVGSAPAAPETGRGSIGEGLCCGSSGLPWCLHVDSLAPGQP
jgi:hypothetical protein